MNPVSVKVTGLMTAKNQMALLKMPMPKRRRLIARVARKVISDGKARVRSQRDLQGMPYPERARKLRGGRKMLSKLSRELKVVRADGTEAKIGFYRRSSARIAAKQQYGDRQRISARSLEKSNTNRGKDSPATRRQAIALREAGFTINKRQKAGGKKPTLKWVQENLTVGIAGSVLRQLREDAGETIKQSWTTELPARSFLGATPAEVSAHVDTIFTNMTQEIARGRR